MSHVVAPTGVPRLAGLVAHLDRLFPLVWVGLYLLLPVSGWATEMFESWHDQQKFLGALRDVLRDGESELVADNIIGPAYVAFAAAIHGVFGLTPESSLVALNRVAYLVSIAAALVLVRLLVSRTLSVTPLVSLAAQIGFVALVFATGTWWWSDVPWTHFVATALAVALFAVRFSPTRSSGISAVFCGCLIALLAATRSFEMLALVLAWLIAAIILTALRMLPARNVSARHVALGTAAFVATTVSAYAATGKRTPFVLYAGNLDRQSADVLPTEIAETPPLSLGLVPAKLVQLFVDPCYLSLCRVADYETGGGNGSNLDLWSLPLAVQLPALVFLPLCLVGVVTVLLLKRKARNPRDLRTVQLYLELTLAAAGISLGYVAATIAGSSHLRYGYAREFMLPALLTAVVAVSLAACGLWAFLARVSRRGLPSPEMGFLAATVVASVVAVALVAHLRSAGLPRLESRHIAALTYLATCADRRCQIEIRAVNREGEPIAIPKSSTLTFGCASARPRFTLYVADADEVDVGGDCAAPRLVAAWPLVMGLPPGSAELAAVKVRNV
ncbi:MAG TPA: hypothetical protein VMK83_02910 [Gaiellaceae bacterium]|nr:hypothetical protein [Gaiellaceae bacterium]